MNKFVRNLLTEWRRLGLPFEDETMIIAVSGGADSVSLAVALDDLAKRKKLNLNFIIAHFNHNLRGAESESDAEFVKDLAGKLKFEFAGGTPDPKSPIQNQKGNLEQNARSARYKFLGQVAKKHNAFGVLTAHTQNDQAETLLFNLIRGSGLEGLGGMRSVRDFEIIEKFQIQNSKFKIIRPLLNWVQRKDTESFCLENKVRFRQDTMNDDLKFSRVRIRKEIIPLLQKLNPRVIETLAKTAKLLSEDAEELSNISQNNSGNITQKSLKAHSKSMRLRVLRDWLKRHRGDLRQIDLKHLEGIERLIFSRKSGQLIELPDGEKVIKREGKIVFENSRVEKS
jgi:tRNA(Ile)-lysidine synthase